MLKGKTYFSAFEGINIVNNFSYHNEKYQLTMQDDNG